MDAEQAGKGEIIIVRRGGNGEETGHHGGTWKIAYADFMTAMMAFFLVMWLVSATSEETKSAIASYFNPIKLVDEQPEPRGVEEDNVTVETPERDEKKKDPYHVNKSDQPSLTKESQLLDSPFGALETILMLDRGTATKMEVGEKQQDITAMRSVIPPEPVKNTSQDGLTHVHDPFSPHYWDEAAILEEEEELNQIVLLDKKKAQDEARIAEQLSRQDAFNKRQEAMAATLSLALEKLMQEVMAERGIQERPNLRIVAQDEGVLIELSDNQDYGMFDIGSAKPHADIIKFLEGVAKIIALQPGDVVISGHTDQRPYKSDHYDNWQLSSARAQMAYYMLRRGGLDEKRILRVEGYADRDLKNKVDPYADENRRIAIFLKMSQSPSQLEKMTQMGKLEVPPAKVSDLL